MSSPPITTDLATARQAIGLALADFAAVPDGALEDRWTWPDHGPLDIRSGFFVTLEDLEVTAAEIERLGDGRSSAKALIAPAAIAAWDLLGLLVTLDERLLDADPGDGQWTIRRTLSHTLASQRSYAIYTDWWRRRRLPLGTGPLPEPPDDLDLPDREETAADGDLAEVRRLVLAYIDDAAALLADLGDDELGLAARWSGLPVSVAYRQGRWSVHMAEHTIQIEKTLVLLGHQPTEVDRLVRRLAIAWGRLERSLWPAAAAADALPRSAAVARRAAATAADLRSTAERR